jgi:hypothetical protein
MNFKYVDELPSLPDYVVTEILSIVNNPNINFHSSTEIANTYLSDPTLQLSSVDITLLNNLKNFTYDKSTSLGYPMDTASSHFTNLAQFDFLEVTDIIKDWVYKNINPRPSYISIQAMFGGTTITPHIDEARKYAYNYIISGANGITNFYKPSSNFEHLVAYPQTIFTYDRIEVIESLSIEEHRWHYLDVSKIHGVNYIQPGEKRISLSLSYD